MTQDEIKKTVDAQREYFYSGETLDVGFRIAALKKLRGAIKRNEAKIARALKADLGKSATESYMCETGLALSELSYMLSHVRSFARTKRAATPITNFHSTSKVKPSPFGVCLVMSPWNYPFLLTIDPIVDAISAGNTVVAKPSAYSPATSAVIREILSECFDEKYVAVVTGGRAENKFLLAQKFDNIFFTGSQAVGKEVMKAAAEHLAPVTLELGGKSPCVVDESANIALAAKRIVFGKFLNCGQTCVAPDYVLCHESVKEKFIAEVKKQIEKQFGANALQNPNYGKIINEKHFARILSLIDKSKVVHGGNADSATLQIEPTVMDGATWDDAAMREEIFGPVMPIMAWTGIDELIRGINSRPHPLALYVFTSRKKNARAIMGRCGFGGGCVNDTVVHLATSGMAFGGFGESGMGAYHGAEGFRAFSHFKSILDKKNWIDLPLRYQPYSPFWDKIIHLFLK